MLRTGRNGLMTRKLSVKLRSMYGVWRKKLTHRLMQSSMRRCKVKISLNLSLKRQRKNRNNNLGIKKWRKRQHKMYIIEMFPMQTFTIIL